MNEQKKHWQKPVLIVIGRGKPEENVLAICKNDVQIVGPDTVACKTTALTGSCSGRGGS